MRPRSICAADDAATETASVGDHLADGARDGAHAHADASSFERRSRRGGGTQHALAIADDDFPVGAEIDENKRPFALVHLRSQNAAQDVATDEAAEIRQEANARLVVETPTELLCAKAPRFGCRCFERSVRQRPEIDAAEEVVHDRVADENDRFQASVGSAPCRDQLA
jgi:hypothetical protein